MIDSYWDFWLGGIWIAAVAIAIPLLSGGFLGVTKGYASLCSLISKNPFFSKPEFGGKFGVRTLFVFGILTGGFLAAIFNGGFQPTLTYGMFDSVMGNSLWVKIPVLILGGALWGFGARLANGCTSGNSISGLAKGSLASLITTLGFLVAGIFVTHLLNWIAGTL